MPPAPAMQREAIGRIIIAVLAIGAVGAIAAVVALSLLRFGLLRLLLMWLAAAARNE